MIVANSSAREILGLGEGRITGLSLADYVEESAEELQSYLKTCLTSECAVTGSFTCGRNRRQTIGHGRALHPGADDSPILLRCAPTIGRSDDFPALNVRAQSLREEIAHRQQVEAELTAAEAHAQAVLDTAVDAIITINTQGQIQSFNPAAERMFGYAAAEVLGNNVNRLMPQPYSDEHDGYIENYLATGEKKIIGSGRKVTGRRKDGEAFPMALAVSEVMTGGQHHFTGIVRDLSDQVEAEEEARVHRERLAHFDRISTMGEMATGIAHEINQPLAAISSYARACYRLVEAGLREPSDLLEVLDKISAQALRAGEVIHRLRAFVRKRESQREPCDLNEVIQNAIQLAETDAQEHEFTIKPVLVDPPLPVVVDVVQIQQVVLNLIRNAAEAMAGVACHGERVIVTVTTSADDSNSALVAVSDRGGGIADEIADKLFDPFFTTKSSGTGIGLAISRTIVTSHGGRLWFQPNPEAGVTMCFTLPLATEGTNG